MKIELTAEQQNALKMQHKNNGYPCVHGRLRCVILAADDWIATTIAKSQLMNETTAHRHRNDWLNDEKLRPENGDSNLITFLTDNLLPTTQAIIELVNEWWGIRYAVPGLNKWLHRNDFSYKKPTGVPHKFIAEAQQAFVEASTPLKSDVGDEPILLIDGVHPTQGTKLAYGWILKGRKTVVETTGSRTRLNIMGALNLNGTGSTVIREEILSFFRERLPALADALSRSINDNFQTLEKAYSS